MESQKVSATKDMQSAGVSVKNEVISQIIGEDEAYACQTLQTEHVEFIVKALFVGREGGTAVRQ
jgi:hypothetical protein